MKMKTSMVFKVRRLGEQKQRDSRSFFLWIKEKMEQNLYRFQRDKLERELFHSCVILKNLAIVHQELPMSTDFILEQLMESSRPLRYTYADVLTAYRNGKTKEAFQRIYQRIPTKTAQDFVRILCKLEHISPSELILQMTAFEETFSAERKTRAMARAERKSVVTTLASTATIFVVLLNFTVVVIFLDTLQTLNHLF